jgi:hypothetical protein
MISASELYQAPEAETVASFHAHHWLIDGQQGPVSPAFCKLCGAHRDFANAYTRSWSRPVRMTPYELQKTRDKMREALFVAR